MKQQEAENKVREWFRRNKGYTPPADLSPLVYKVMKGDRVSTVCLIYVRSRP